MQYMARVRSNRILPFLGGLLLLMATALPAMVRMQCISAGHTVVQLGVTGDCCPLEEHTDRTTVKALCCEVTNTNSNIQDFREGPSMGVPLPVAVVNGVHDPSVARATAPAQLRLYSVRPPPPTIGRHLATLGTLLI